MSKTVGVNLKGHMAQECTTLATCFRLTVTQQLPVIVAVIYDGTDMTVSTSNPHLLPVGTSVQIKDVNGVTGINDSYYIIESIGASAFTVADPGAGGTYVDGGAVKEAFGLCNIDMDIVYEGVTYKAGAGGLPTNLRLTSDLSVANMENAGIYTDDDVNITKSDIFSGRLDFSEMQVFTLNYEDLTMEDMILSAGFMGPLKLERERYVAEFFSLNQVLTKDTSRSIGNLCTNTLGDTKCGVDTTLWDDTGAVTTVTSQDTIIDT